MVKKPPKGTRGWRVGNQDRGKRGLRLWVRDANRKPAKAKGCVVAGIAGLGMVASVAWVVTTAVRHLLILV